MKKILIAPSILSADFGAMRDDVARIEKAGADFIHCDVMDGHFVPNITFGPQMVAVVKKSVSIPLDVHLMIENPHRYVDAFCDAGADILTVHAEAAFDLPAVLNLIKKKNVRTGVSINPAAPVSLFLPYLDMIDQVLIMTVNAGFGGQSLIPETIPKINEVFLAAASRGLSVDIEVDGGINDQTAALCARSGANVFVAGSYVFKAADYATPITAIRSSAGATFCGFSGNA